jgi:glutamate/tyrosine decarboxylase-like PLP-dependent enzyme
MTSDQGQDLSLEKVLGDMHPYRDKYTSYDRLPPTGRDRQEILAELAAIAAQEDHIWETGQVSGTIYHGGRDHYAFLNQVFALFSHMNLLQRDMCPSGTKFEGEVIAMVANVLNAPAVRQHNPQDEVCGVITSGGSDSIQSAMLVYRDWARAEKGITQPEMVVPTTIHPAFEKGAHYFGIQLIKVPVGEDYRADVDAMRSQITPNTIALAGSAANYPHGIIDPLEELSNLALEHAIGFHVDGCLGGFILPWIERLGYPLPVFDFRLPGVTSMSCDTHKWGYSLKGTSVVLYRNHNLRRYQYFTTSEWAGGMYISPTFQGSRSAGLSAAAWAAMVAIGEEGYLGAARGIMNAADTIRAGIASIPEIKIIGETTFVIGMTSDEVDIYHVNDYLRIKGWRMNGLQNPPGFHFCMTGPQSQPGVAERFVADLKDGVAYAKDPPSPTPVSGAVYGLASSLPGQMMLKEMLLYVLDEMYAL